MVYWVEDWRPVVSKLSEEERLRRLRGSLVFWAVVNGAVLCGGLALLRFCALLWGPKGL